MDNGLCDLIKIAIDLTGQVPESPAAPPEVIELSRGGSDRRFFRITDGEHSTVSLIQPGGGPEFEWYIKIGEFLSRNGIGVPVFHRIDHERGVVIMEDLGDVHLEDALRIASEKEELSLYRRCLEILVRLETSVTQSMEREGLLVERVFDRDVLLGETSYFMEEFINNYCTISLPGGWEKERQYLAVRLSGLPAVFMHRDFQSRNILIKDGRLTLVDFQTAHRGPGMYDAASLLKDAYHPLSKKTRLVFLRELYDGLRGADSNRYESFDTFVENFVLAGIQRNLQALAAFARLGLKRGKREFLDSIPNGLALLEEGIEEAGGFHALKKMICEIKIKLQKGSV